MIEVNVRVEVQMKRVAEAEKKESFNNLRHAAASISKDAKSSIKQAVGPSEPGDPPHTHRGSYIRRGIRYVADKEEALIGTAASVVGESGSAHELGGTYKGNEFDQRPFMLPALERGEPRLLESWRGSIGE